MLIDLIEKSNRGSLCVLREDVASSQVLPELNQIDVGVEVVLNK